MKVPSVLIPKSLANHSPGWVKPIGNDRGSTKVNGEPWLGDTYPYQSITIKLVNHGKPSNISHFYGNFYHIYGFNDIGVLSFYPLDLP